ncbi:leader peptidase (prepilin peptidase)/N-methyltransferase [Paenibacillus endophyticus]|uniref:Leader peptidase (Prepilin peptidase)/N-methyltransferase n=1 Tax=Paenibacillus endophyticus TaxID=1294268 RepID=A0A7W5C5L9_9BACL|nr:A24 family peptidase [Paenibacillus endophyticus]MBB3151230.1 leader peptidase (prepilin peptidase)/N-methyltransferase [Paenibacillus endophyticus]
MIVLYIFVIALLGMLVSGILSAIAIQWDTRFQSVNPPIYALNKQTKQRYFTLIPLFKKIMSGINQRKIKPSMAWRYALGEFMTTVLFAHAAYTIGWEPELLAVLFFISILVIIVQTDLTDMIIPNKVVAVGVIGAIVIRLFIHPLPLLNYGIAALAGSGALLLIGIISSWILKKETMGGGDIKLYVFIGLILGVKLTLLSLFLASLFGLIGGIVLLATGAHSKGKTIPFGPYIAVGALAAYYWGNGLIDWYLSFLSY